MVDLVGSSRILTKTNVTVQLLSLNPESLYLSETCHTSIGCHYFSLHCQSDWALGNPNTYEYIYHTLLYVFSDVQLPFSSLNDPLQCFITQMSKLGFFLLFQDTS